MDERQQSGGPAADEIRFMQLVAMFQMAAMQQMGKLVNPVTNEMERDLDQARASIDILEMLKRRTEGNRTATENQFLDKILFELHMNYVEEQSAKAPEDADTASGEPDAKTSGGDDAESSSDSADPEK